MNKRYQKEIDLGLRRYKEKKSKVYSKSEERDKIDKAMKDFLSRGGKVNKQVSYGKYYVYTLRDGNIPFYVGKGSGDRAYRHEILVGLGHTTNGNRYLTNRIKNSKEKGTMKCVIEFRTTDEEYAYKKEMELISKFRNEGYKLCNKTMGGDGSRAEKYWEPMYLLK